jgi:hypothetical protein
LTTQPEWVINPKAHPSILKCPSTIITNQDISPNIGSFHVLTKVVDQGNELADVSTPKKQNPLALQPLFKSLAV